MFGDNPLSLLARSLLAGERGLSENDALKSRVLDRARASLDSERPSGVTFRRSEEPSAPTRPRSLRVAWLAAAALAVAGLAAAAGVVARSWGTQATPPPAPGPVALEPAAVEPDRQPETSPSPADTTTASPAEPTPVEPRAERSSERERAPSAPQSYAAEVALLEPARSSIGRGDYAAALAVLAKHRREYPKGRLVEEREALRVRALWGLGQKEPALAAAKAFRKRYPRSALLGWLSAQGDGAR